MMPKRIFPRLLVTYSLLTLLITVLLAVSLSIGFHRYLFAEKQRQLQAAAVKAEYLVSAHSQGKLSTESMQTGLDNLGYITDSDIYVLKLNRSAIEKARDGKISGGLEVRYLREDLLRILAGQEVYRQKVFSQSMADDVVFLGVPLHAGDRIAGAVLLYAPLTGINRYLFQINGLIGLIALVVLAASYIYISITARRITRPIRNMAESARQLAAGEDIPDLSDNSGDEIAELAASFNYMKHRMAFTEKMRKELLADISHELRTPLTSINGFIQGMADGLVPAGQQSRYLDIVLQETGRLIRLTGEILDLAKIQSGSIALHMTDTNLRELCEEAAFQFGATGNPQEISVYLDCAEGQRIQADPDRLRQILHNLISNARRYGGELADVSLTVKARDDFIEFAVSDNGPGIPPEDLPYVFDRFYRRAEHNAAGSGLGLAIVKKLVEMHGGAISVQSQPGQGTVFIFKLPA